MINPSSKMIMLVSSIGLAVLTQQAGSQEKRINRNSVPQAILSAFEHAYPKAKAKGYSTETENGRTLFEIESSQGKMSLDVLYNLDGTVVEVEEGVAPKDLPATVRQTVGSRYPQGRIDIAERKSVGEKVTYELSVQVGKNKVSVEVDSSGKIVNKSKSVGEEEENEEED